jgi:hypothetical protein
VPVAGREDSYGGIDYYIVFRNEDDTWSDPVNMGDKVNTAGSMEYSPYVSGDGKYFFFMTSRVLPREAWPEPVTYSFIQRLHNMPDNGNSTVYWVETAFIEAFRQGRKRMEPIESDS